MDVEHVGREHCLGKEVASEEGKVDGWKHFEQVESDVGFLLDTGEEEQSVGLVAEQSVPVVEGGGLRDPILAFPYLLLAND